MALKPQKHTRKSSPDAPVVRSSAVTRQIDSYHIDPIHELMTWSSVARRTMKGK